MDKHGPVIGGIEIRSLQEYSDFLKCEDIQREAWKMTSERDIVPAHLMSPVIKYGGIALGAFDRDKMVGFVFGFVGQSIDERAGWMGTSIIHCSEMMGVLPEYRSKSVGFQLKLAQRLYAIEQGHRLMVWTFDPLLSPNAWLNIGKLGCLCRHYVRDAYGIMGGIYAGLSTDRFEVEWWLTSEHVKTHIHQQQRAKTPQEWISAGAELVNKCSVSNELLIPPDAFAPFNADTHLVQIPRDFQRIKESDMSAAKAWRAHTRVLFESAFEEGYVIISFTSEPHWASYYVLSKNIQIDRIAREV